MNQHHIIRELEKKLLLENLPEETRTTVIARLGEAILERTMLSIVASLTEDEARMVTELQEKGLLDETFTYIMEKHGELEGVVLGHIDDVLKEFLEA